MIRALASHPGSIPAQCHVWVEFVVGFRHAPRVVPGTNPVSPNSSWSRIRDQHKLEPAKAFVASSLNLVI